MQNNSNMHQEALIREGKELFPLLEKFPEYYLAGGTALALQLGHRISVDFDLFHDTEIPPTVLTKVKKIFAEYSVLPSVNNPNELTVFVNTVKITFLHYPFPLVRPLVPLEGAVRAASIQEIAAMKAYTIGRRTSFKDYVDMYEIIAAGHIMLPEVMKLALEKYKNEFNDRLFLEQLLSLDEVEDEEIRFLQSPVSRMQVQRFFEEQIKSLKL